MVEVTRSPQPDPRAKWELLEEIAWQQKKIEAHDVARAELRAELLAAEASLLASETQLAAAQTEIKRLYGESS